MAFRRKYKRRQVKRAYHKKRFVKRKRGFMIPKKIFGFPNEFYTKLKYNQGNISFTTGTNSKFEFRLNSLYDPDYTGTGHQPRFYDQFSAIYGRYQVYGVKAYCFVHNNSTTESAKMVLFTSTNHTDSGTDWAAEKNGAIVRILSPVGSKNQVSMSKYYNNNYLLGVKRGASESDYSAPITGNPVKELFLVLIMRNLDGATAIDITVDFTFKFYVKFFEKKFVDTS